jgi:hypothetical protein
MELETTWTSWFCASKKSMMTLLLVACPIPSPGTPYKMFIGCYFESYKYKAIGLKQDCHPLVVRIIFNYRFSTDF